MADERTSFRAPRGTRDVLPPESWRWQSVIRLAMDTFARAGYAPVETPIFEHTEVFERGVGEASEVVTKQMYTFHDRAGRSLTLRPEGTAPVVRAVLEHGRERGPLPVKLAYAGPMFRQERPQKGRYRQLFQLGVEAIGSDSPLIDAEVIELALAFYARAGLEDVSLLLNSIGHPASDCRTRYLGILVDFLRANDGELAEEDRARVETNPLRTFDSKEQGTIEVMKGAPKIADHLCPACTGHFEEVRERLADIGVAFELDPTLVRGLDYYTRTTFEFVAAGLGAQDAVGAGGRYDELAEALGGPRLPSIGFALGLDRILLALGDRAQEPLPATEVYVVALGEKATHAALSLAVRLRAAGIGAEFDVGGRSMKGQMKDAVRAGARWAVILGEEEMRSGTASIKELASGEQRTVRWDEIERSLHR